MSKLSKSQRKQVRKLLELAYTRELASALERLESSFQEWRSDAIDALELDQRIHEYHKGPARKLWSRYSSHSHWEILLPAALHNGILTRDDFPADLWDALGERLEELKVGLFES